VRSNPDFLLGGRASASAECRRWSGRAVRWSSCAILLSSTLRRSIVRVLSRASEPAGTARPHLLRISGARKSVVAVTRGGNTSGRVLINRDCGASYSMSAMPHSDQIPLPVPGLMHRSKERRYSITSSASASKFGGISRPSALAVLRLIAISNFTGACAGRSAGLVPFRMRSM
jgi:hypothetical protein